MREGDVNSGDIEADVVESGLDATGASAAREAAGVGAAATDGDFSGIFTSPSEIRTLDLGSNMISATSTVGATIVFVGLDPHFPGQDVDVFSFSISPGQPLDSIILTSFSYNTHEGYIGGCADWDGTRRLSPQPVSGR
jgi:hypothetical protein